MNLETKLEPALWDAVRASYEARNYAAAILDAIHSLSDLIRERADLDSDGVPLVGAAFGGNTPRLKVNRLRTESEQNIQRGVEALLRGVYQAIRNPRSHGKCVDEERDAVAIILFVDFLMRTVGKSKNPFSLETIVERILDRDFVPTKQYADLVVSRIPQSKRMAVCREVFGRRARADSQKVRCFFEAVLAVMSEDEREELLSIVSDELTTTDDQRTILFVLQALPNSFWPQLDEVARLRIENKLIDSVRDGQWTEETSGCTAGSFGTWITNIRKELTLKSELWLVLGTKLTSNDEGSKTYVFKYFISKAPEVFEEPPKHLIRTMISGLRSGDVRFKDAIERWMEDLDWSGDDSAVDAWSRPFQKALASFQPRASTQDEEVPF